MFLLSNKLYDVLKYCVMVAIPALTTAYVGLSGIWGWPYAEEVAKTSAVVCTLLWSLTGHITAMIVGASLVFVIRILSAAFKWNLPRAD